MRRHKYIASAEALERRALLSAQVIGQYTFEPQFGASIGYDVAVQPDGKTVAVGVTAPAGGDSDVLVLRYGTDGRYDTSFGLFGITTIDVGPGDVGFSVAIGKDGKIVVAGETMRGKKRIGLLARLNADGSRDNGFGAAGIVTFALDPKLTRARDVALWGDKIVVAGSAGDNLMLARFNANGTFDPAFSGDGIDLRDFGGLDGASSIHIGGADGRILVGGSTSNGAGGSDIALLRYRPGGNLDRRFSDDGVQVMDFAGGVDRANAVSVDAGGRIVFAGTVGNGTANYAGMGRVHASGRMDRTFGRRGWFYDANAKAELFSVVEQANGDFRVGGSALPTKRRISLVTTITKDGMGQIDLSRNGVPAREEQPVYGIALADQQRAVWAGGEDVLGGSSLDPSGRMFPTLLAPGESVSSIQVLPDGKAVLAGASRDGILLTRVNKDGSVDRTFARNGRTMAFLPRHSTGYFELDGISHVRVQPDGKLLVVNDYDAGPGEGIVVARFTADGQLDTTFGDAGMELESSSDDFVLTHAVMQPDGKLLVGGGEVQYYPRIARFGASGHLDPAFVGDGFLRPDEFADLFAGQPYRPGEYPGSVEVADNGDIMLSGVLYYSQTPGLYYLRLKSDGSVDRSFGTDGFRYSLTDQNPDPLGEMQRDGTFLRNGSDTSIDLVRHDRNGTLDTGFGTAGHARLNLTGAFGLVDKELGADGKIVVTGVLNGSDGKRSVVVARFNGNGTVDQSFGGGDGWDSADVAASDGIARVQVTESGVTVVMARGPWNQFVAFRFSL